MYRSGSSTRVSDELLFSQPSSTTTTTEETTEQQHLLPMTYTPQSANKDKIRLRSAQSAVHIIPLLLLLCALVLWFFSTPVDITKKGDSIAGKVRI